MRKIRLLAVFVFTMLAVWFGAARDALAAAEPVAYIEHVYPNSLKIRDVVRIKRDGQWVNVANDSVPLYPDDQIYVSDSNGVVTLRYIADNLVEGARSHSHGASDASPDYVVRRPALSGLPHALGAWFEAQLKGADQSENGLTLTASKGAFDQQTCYNTGGKTDEPTKFDVPIFAADQSEILSGDRALFVAWHGGAAPFVVRLSPVDNGTPVAEISNIQSRCSVTLPRTHLFPGRYRLSVVDANGTAETETSLIAVTQVPGMPATLESASLPDNERALYYQTWLSATDRGRWAFEAMQNVAAMDCKWAPAKEWLARWGDVPECQP
ncbi:hypothetical protein M0D69_03265 [Caballeronia sp. SEWSISQ10-4 2]|uniref:hypothetical protein n=1 Tax=Caballeronia sp. SEWSISQ10-4 2 TaxID=2937438 RepID=UPI0026518EC7|nr:hypothetical protein [Caballeronia sp. SEWSISQ10-4 2]MDN7177050.1 hypothetical protein [Caballeronia sp. SEWSISQ10-4 2]